MAVLLLVSVFRMGLAGRITELVPCSFSQCLVYFGMLAVLFGVSEVFGVFCGA